MKILRLISWFLLFILSACANREPQAEAQAQPIMANPYSQGTILREAEDFFGRGAQGVADAFNRVFADNGPPGAYIRGEAPSVTKCAKYASPLRVFDNFNSKAKTP